MAGDENLTSARASIDAFNRADWTAIRELISEDYVSEETGTGRRFSGVDDVIAACAGWKSTRDLS